MKHDKREELKNYESYQAMHDFYIYIFFFRMKLKNEFYKVKIYRHISLRLILPRDKFMFTNDITRMKQLPIA